MNHHRKNIKVIFGVIAILLSFTIGEKNIYANSEDFETQKNIVDTDSPDKNSEDNINIDETEKDKDEIINIKDVNLKIAINKELGKSNLNFSITKSEIESLKTISTRNGSNKNIKSLSGLEYAINLESADLSNNNIENISSIKNIFIDGNLKNIDLSNQSINLGDQSTLDTKNSISNIIFNIDNNKVNPNYISDNGKYIEGNIVWDNLENFKDYNLYYAFEDNINKDGKSLVFSGKVYEKLKVGGNDSLINNIPTIYANKKEESNNTENNQRTNNNETSNPDYNKENIDEKDNNSENNSLNEKDSIGKDNNSENKIMNIDNGEEEDKKNKEKEENDISPEDLSIIAVFGIGLGFKFLNMK